VRRVVLSVVLAVLVGCVSTNAVMLGPMKAQRPPIATENVRIYRTSEQVKAKYDELALLHSSGESDFTNEPKMIASMQKKAGALGANAIILGAITEASAGAKVAGAIFGTGTERKGRAIAIFIYPDSVAK